MPEGSASGWQQMVSWRAVKKAAGHTFDAQIKPLQKSRAENVEKTLPDPRRPMALSVSDMKTIFKF